MSTESTVCSDRVDVARIRFKSGGKHQLFLVLTFFVVANGSSLAYVETRGRLSGAKNEKSLLSASFENHRIHQNQKYSWGEFETA